MAPTATTSTNPAMQPMALAFGPETDCQHVNELVDHLAEGLPLTAADEEYLLDHRGDCSPCFDDIRKQHIFVEFVNARVARRVSPSALHGNILAQVLA